MIGLIPFLTMSGLGPLERVWSAARRARQPIGAWGLNNDVRVAAPAPKNPPSLSCLTGVAN